MSNTQVTSTLRRGVLILLTGTLLFMALSTGAARAQDLALAQGLIALALVLWLVGFWMEGGRRLFIPPVLWAGLLFGLYAAVWYGQAQLEYVARRDTVYVLFLLSLIWLAVQALKDQGGVRWFVAALVIVSALIAAYGIFQFATGLDRVWAFVRPEQYEGRGSGTFICPNHFAAFLGMVFPLALGQAILGRGSMVIRLLQGYAALLMLAGIVVSLSRGAWLATGLVLLLILGVLLRRRGGWILAALLAVVLGVGVYLLLNKSSLARTRFSYEQTLTRPHEMRTRLWVWQSAWAMWQAEPWIGMGPGHFDHRFPAFRVRLAQNRPGRVHNDYLNILVDWGAVGGVLGAGFLGLLGWGGLRTWRYLRRSGNELSVGRSDRGAFVFGAGGGLVFAAAHSVVEFNLFVPATGALAACLAGGLASHLRYATSRHWFRASWPALALLAVLVTAGAVVFGTQGMRMVREARALAAADRPEIPLSARLSSLERAVTIEPGNYETRFALGEALRLSSWRGDSGWERQAWEAMKWYRSADAVNPWSPYHPLHLGMCLDWLGYPDVSEKWFTEALRRDPRNYYVTAIYGWHATQEGNWEEARDWFKRSLAIKGWPNPIANRYLRITERRLKELRR